MFWHIKKYLREQGWKDWSVVQTKSSVGLIWSVFRQEDSHPSLVAKYSGNDRGRESLRQECSALSRLNPVAANLHIPQLLLNVDSPNPGFLFAQTGLPGVPMREGIYGENPQVLAAQLKLIVPWLRNFQASRGERPAHAVAASLDGYLKKAESAGVPELTEEVAAMKPLLDSLPTVPVHGDFWHGNILLDGKNIGVLDWSNFHYGAPTEDLFNFIAAPAFGHGQNYSESAEAIWKIIFGGSSYTALAKTTILQALAHHSVDTGVRPLFLLFVLSRLCLPEFHNHPAWVVFAKRYIESGMPAPFEPASS